MMDLDGVLARVRNPMANVDSQDAECLADIVEAVRITPRERIVLADFFADRLTSISMEQRTMIEAIAKRVWEATKP